MSCNFVDKTGNKINVLVLASSVFIYVMILLYPLPTSAYLWRYDYLILPGVFAVAHKWGVRRVAPVVVFFSLSLIASGILLSEGWNLGITTGSFLAGKLPFSDSQGYLAGAIEMMQGGRLDGISSLRPFAISWTALNLYISGENLKCALALVAFLCSLGMALAVARLRVGWVSSWLFHLLIFFFYRPFVGSLMTEQAGVFFGCVAFALLWGNFSYSFLAGLFVLSMGLITRAGAFFLLPVLAIWFSYHKGFSMKKFLAASLVVLLAFGANQILLETVGNPKVGFGNFSQTLYGIVHGGDWTQGQSEVEGLKGMHDAESIELLYAASFKKIKDDPLSLFRGAARAYKGFLFSSRGAYSFVMTTFLSGDFAELISKYYGGISSVIDYVKRAPFRVSVPFASATVWFAGCYLLAILGFFRMWRLGLNFGFVAFALIGIMLSVPFLPPPDAGHGRVYAATIPFFALLPSLAFAKRTREQDGVSRNSTAAVALAFCAAIIVFPLFMALNTPRNGGVKIIKGSEIFLGTEGGVKLFQKYREDARNFSRYMNSHFYLDLDSPKYDEKSALGIAYFAKEKLIGYVFWDTDDDIMPGEWLQTEEEWKFLTELKTQKAE